MPTASATGSVTNTGNTPTTYRARLVVQRLTPDEMLYLDPIYGTWSPTTVPLNPTEASVVFAVPSVTFDLFGGYKAQARVQVSAVSPPNDLAGFSPWRPEPPFVGGTIVSGSWSTNPTIARVQGREAAGQFEIKITDEAETREVSGVGWLIGVGAVLAGLLWLGSRKRSTASRR